MNFKIGQLVTLNDNSRARVLGAGAGPRRFRVMRLDGVEQELPAGDIALPGEDREIHAREVGALRHDAAACGEGAYLQNEHGERVAITRTGTSLISEDIAEA